MAIIMMLITMVLWALFAVLGVGLCKAAKNYDK